MSAAMVGICIPSLLLGPLLILIFGIYLDWLPVSGWGDMPGDKILPAVTLGAVYAAYIARLSRAGMLEIMTQDYIRTAQGPRAYPNGALWWCTDSAADSPQLWPSSDPPLRACCRDPSSWRLFSRSPG